MKSGTLCCEKTLIRKNITRFAPIWILYTLSLLLGLILLNDTGSRGFYFPLNVAQNSREMALVNFLYAPVVAQLLFGDLYDSRMCGGLHALPLGRGQIFRANFLSALWFTLIPTAVMSLVMLPLLATSNMEGGWMLSFLWFGAANLEFFFFFSLSALCCLCVGSRFAMAVVYGILNFGAMILYFIVDSLFTPMFPGVSTPAELFERFCPLVRIAGTRLIYCENLAFTDELGRPFFRGVFHLDRGWGYLWTCVALGVLLLGLTLVLYKKRRLECAGDFSAFAGLKPIFQVVFSLCMGAAFQLVYQLLVYAVSPIRFVFAAIGLVVGWFVGKMFLERTTRVFGKRSWAGLGILSACVGLCFLLAALDPLGIRSWVPETEEVTSVNVMDRYFTPEEMEKNRLTDPEDVDLARRYHALCIDHAVADPGYARQMDRYPVRARFHYELTDGRSMDREYNVYMEDELLEAARQLYSRPIYLFGWKYRDLDWAEDIVDLTHGSLFWGEEDLEPGAFRDLLEAVRLDCEQGHLFPGSDYSDGTVYGSGDLVVDVWYLNLHLRSEGVEDYLALWICAESENCLRWLRETGLEKALIEEAESY